MTHVLILNEAVTTKEFSSGKNFYEYTKYQLKDVHNFIIKECSITNSNDIKNAISGLPDNSLKFLWIRGHGSPTSIAMNPDIAKTNSRFNLVVALDNDEKKRQNDDTVENVFQELPDKLHEHAYISLDSCLTAKYIYRKGEYKKNTDEVDFKNIAFEFVKLTKNLVNVCVSAPTEESHINGSFIDTDGNFSSLYLNEKYNEIGACFGPAVKTKLNLNSEVTKQDINDDHKLVIFNDRSKIVGIASIAKDDFWATPSKIRFLLNNHTKFEDPMETFEFLLKYLAPVQFIDGNEEKDLENNYLSIFSNSILMECLVRNTINNCTTVKPWFWLVYQAEQWVKTTYTTDEYKKYVKDIIGKYGNSNLCKETVLAVKKMR
jgi:hypothetical protein